jgi:hypothetical protein
MQEAGRSNGGLFQTFIAKTLYGGAALRPPAGLDLDCRFD